MPHTDTINYDASATSTEPYFNADAVIRHPGGKPGIWRVRSTKISGTSKQGVAVLDEIAIPTPDEVASAVTWDPLRCAWS
jgi:hypothetical protein